MPFGWPLCLWTVFLDAFVAGSCFVIEFFQSDGNEQWKRQQHSRTFICFIEPNETRWTVHSSQLESEKRRRKWKRKQLHVIVGECTSIAQKWDSAVKCGECKSIGIKLMDRKVVEWIVSDHVVGVLRVLKCVYVYVSNLANFPYWSHIKCHRLMNKNNNLLYQSQCTLFSTACLALVYRLLITTNHKQQR